jgi:TIR domain
MANVFVSHRSSDLALATQLATELVSAGNRVWLDEWELSLGDSIVERIDNGLSGATFVLLCCSSAGVHSPWMSREWMSTLSRQLNGKMVKLIPVLLSGHDVPAILDDISMPTYSRIGKLASLNYARP